MRYHFALTLAAFLLAGSVRGACVPVGGNIYYGTCHTPTVDGSTDFGGPAPGYCMPMIETGFWQGQCKVEFLRGDVNGLPRAEGKPINAKVRTR
jgi:hypothetical protein